eukprot:1101176-Amphidinium_carterae.1
MEKPKNGKNGKRPFPSARGAKHANVLVRSVSPLVLVWHGVLCLDWRLWHVRTTAIVALIHALECVCSTCWHPCWHLVFDGTCRFLIRSYLYLSSAEGDVMEAFGTK